MESIKERIRGLADRLRQRQMEIKVGFDVGFGIFLRAIHDRDRLAHGCEILLLDALRRQGSDSRFENQGAAPPDEANLSCWPIFTIRSNDCRAACEVPSVMKVPRPE